VVSRTAAVQGTASGLRPSSGDACHSSSLVTQTTGTTPIKRGTYRKTRERKAAARGDRISG